MSHFADSEIVIIGGGAVGCGVAYSLASAGHREVLLIEREGDVGRVTTAQGAGLCGQVRSSADRVRLAMHSVHTFRELQRGAEARPDWHEVGSIRLVLFPHASRSCGGYRPSACRPASRSSSLAAPRPRGSGCCSTSAPSRRRSRPPTGT